MTSERDPKKYPKAGDVLTRFGTIRHVTGVATNVRGTLIRVFFDGGDPGDRTCSVSIGAWRGWTQDDCQVLLRDETSDDGETPQMLIATHRCGGLVASSWLDDGFDEVNRQLGHDWHAKGYLVSKISVPDGTPMMRWCECNRQGQQDIGDKSSCTCGPVRHWECNAGCKAKSTVEPVAALAATPEAPQAAALLGTPQNPICIDSEEMARLAEFAGISVDNREDAAGILLWVGEHRDDDGTVGYGLCASLEDYPEEGCYPLVELPRQQPAADGAATLRSAIQAMASMLQAREWAEHVSTSADPDVTDLEVQITELVGTATKLREQNATLVAALERIITACPQIGLNPNATMSSPPEEKICWNVHSIARAALASAKGGAQ